jgi:hypothetical protein
MKSGFYKYLVVNHNGKYFMYFGLMKEGHPSIANIFLELLKESSKIRKDCELKGGVLEWSHYKKHISYYSGCIYGPNTAKERKDFKKVLKKLMKNKGISYDDNLNKAPEEAYDFISN